MNTTTDVCNFCNQNTRCISYNKNKNNINNLKLLLNKTILDHNNFDQQKRNIKICPTCVHNLHLVNEIRLNILNSNGQVCAGCVMCGSNDNVIKIKKEWTELFYKLSEISSQKPHKNLEDTQICVQCCFFIDTLYKLKQNLFTTMPALKAPPNNAEPVSPLVSAKKDSLAERNDPPQNDSPEILQLSLQTILSNINFKESLHNQLSHLSSLSESNFVLHNVRFTDNKLTNSIPFTCLTKYNFDNLNLKNKSGQTNKQRRSNKIFTKHLSQNKNIINKPIENIQADEVDNLRNTDNSEVSLVIEKRREENDTKNGLDLENITDENSSTEFLGFDQIETVQTQEYVRRKSVDLEEHMSKFPELQLKSLDDSKNSQPYCTENSKDVSDNLEHEKENCLDIDNIERKESHIECANKEDNVNDNKESPRKGRQRRQDNFLKEETMLVSEKELNLKNKVKDNVDVESNTKETRRKGRPRKNEETNNSVNEDTEKIEKESALSEIPSNRRNSKSKGKSKLLVDDISSSTVNNEEEIKINQSVSSDNNNDDTNNETNAEKNTVNKVTVIEVSKVSENDTDDSTEISPNKETVDEFTLNQKETCITTKEERFTTDGVPKNEKNKELTSKVNIKDNDKRKRSPRKKREQTKEIKETSEQAILKQNEICSVNKNMKEEEKREMSTSSTVTQNNSSKDLSSEVNIKESKENKPKANDNEKRKRRSRRTDSILETSEQSALNQIKSCSTNENMTEKEDKVTLDGVAKNYESKEEHKDESVEINHEDKEKRRSRINSLAERKEEKPRPRCRKTIKIAQTVVNEETLKTENVDKINLNDRLSGEKEADSRKNINKKISETEKTMLERSGKNGAILKLEQKWKTKGEMKGDFNSLVILLNNVLDKDKGQDESVVVKPKCARKNNISEESLKTDQTRIKRKASVLVENDPDDFPEVSKEDSRDNKSDISDGLPENLTETTANINLENNSVVSNSVGKDKDDKPFPKKRRLQREKKERSPDVKNDNEDTNNKSTNSRKGRPPKDIDENESTITPFGSENPSQTKEQGTSDDNPKQDDKVVSLDVSEKKDKINTLVENENTLKSDNATEEKRLCTSSNTTRTKEKLKKRRISLLVESDISVEASKEKDEQNETKDETKEKNQNTLNENTQSESENPSEKSVRPKRTRSFKNKERDKSKNMLEKKDGETEPTNEEKRDENKLLNTLSTPEESVEAGHSKKNKNKTDKENSNLKKIGDAIEKSKTENQKTLDKNTPSGSKELNEKSVFPKRGRPCKNKERGTYENILEENDMDKSKFTEGDKLIEKLDENALLNTSSTSEESFEHSSRSKRKKHKRDKENSNSGEHSKKKGDDNEKSKTEKEIKKERVTFKIRLKTKNINLKEKGTKKKIKDKNNIVSKYSEDKVLKKYKFYKTLSVNLEQMDFNKFFELENVTKNEAKKSEQIDLDKANDGNQIKFIVNERIVESLSSQINENTEMGDLYVTPKELLQLRLNNSTVSYEIDLTKSPELTPKKKKSVTFSEEKTVEFYEANCGISRKTLDVEKENKKRVSLKLTDKLEDFSLEDFVVLDTSDCSEEEEEENDVNDAEIMQNGCSDVIDIDNGEDLEETCDESSEEINRDNDSEKINEGHTEKNNEDSQTKDNIKDSANSNLKMNNVDMEVEKSSEDNGFNKEISDEPPLKRKKLNDMEEEEQDNNVNNPTEETKDNTEKMDSGHILENDHGGKGNEDDQEQQNNADSLKETEEIEGNKDKEDFQIQMDEDITTQTKKKYINNKEKNNDNEIQSVDKKSSTETKDPEKNDDDHTEQLNEDIVLDKEPEKNKENNDTLDKKMQQINKNRMIETEGSEITNEENDNEDDQTEFEESAKNYKEKQGEDVEGVQTNLINKDTTTEIENEDSLDKRAERNIEGISDQNLTDKDTRTNNIDEKAEKNIEEISDQTEDTWDSSIESSESEKNLEVQENDLDEISVKDLDGQVFGNIDNSTEQLQDIEEEEDPTLDQFISDYVKENSDKLIGKDPDITENENDSDVVFEDKNLASSASLLDEDDLSNFTDDVDKILLSAENDAVMVEESEETLSAISENVKNSVNLNPVKGLDQLPGLSNPDDSRIRSDDDLLLEDLDPDFLNLT